MEVLWHSLALSQMLWPFSTRNTVEHAKAPKQHCWQSTGREASSTSGAVQALLTSIIAEPNAPVDSLCFVTEAERDVLLHSFDGPHLALPQQTIHGMLEHWAAATPDAPAVAFEVWICCTPSHTLLALPRICAEEDAPCRAPS